MEAEERGRSRFSLTEKQLSQNQNSRVSDRTKGLRQDHPCNSRKPTPLSGIPHNSDSLTTIPPPQNPSKKKARLHNSNPTHKRSNTSAATNSDPRLKFQFFYIPPFCQLCIITQSNAPQILWLLIWTRNGEPERGERLRVGKKVEIFQGIGREDDDGEAVKSIVSRPRERAHARRLPFLSLGI